MQLFSFLSRLRRRLLSLRSAPDRAFPPLGVLKLEERKLLDATFAFDGVAGLNLADFDLTGNTSELAIGQSGNELLFDLDSGSWNSAAGDVADAGITIDGSDSSVLRVDRSIFEDGGDQLSLSVTDNNTIGLDVRFQSDLTLPTSPVAGAITVSGSSLTIDAGINAGANSVHFTGSDIQVFDDLLASSGNVTLDAGVGTIADADGVTISTGGHLTLQAGSIALGDEDGNQLHAGRLTFQSGGAVQLSEDSSSELTGSNSAGSLTFATSGSLTSAAGSSLDVAGRATLTADTIDLNNADGRTLNLGSLSFSADGPVVVNESDGMHLADDSAAAGNVTLTSEGNLSASDGVTLTGQQIQLVALESGTQAGDVGSATDELRVAGTLLQVTSNGNQYLAANGTVEVISLVSTDNSAHFDAAGGNGTIALQDGHFLLDSANAVDGDLFVHASASINGTGQIDSLNLLSDAVLKVAVGGTTANTQYDQLEIAGSLQLAGRLQVNLSSFAPSVGDSFLILQNDGNDAVAGSFDGMAEGHLFAVGDHAFQISYVGGDGNDVVLTAKGTAGLHATLAAGTLSLNGHSGASDRVTLSDDGNQIIVRDTSGNILTTDIAGATRTGDSELRFSKALFAGAIDVSTGEGSDVLTVDFNAGDLDRVVRFDGGNPTAGAGDGLAVVGRADLSAAYAPDAVIPGAGVVSVGGATTTSIGFTGLEPIDISGFQSVGVSLPGADDLLTLAGGTDFFAGGTQAALRLSGTSGGVAFETAAFYNNASLIINTATGIDGNDSIQLQSTGTLHGNQNLTLNTGSGNDAITLTGLVAVTGNLTLGNVPVTLSADSTLQGDLVNVLGDISDGSSSFTLSLQGTRGVSVGGSISTARLQVLSTVNAAAVTLTDSLTTSAALSTTTGSITVAGTTSLGANLTSAADISLNGAVTLTNAATLTGGGTITVAGAMDGPHNLTLNSTGSTQISAAVGETTALGSGTGAAVRIRSAGTTVFAASVAVQSGIVQENTAGSLTFRGDVTAAAGDTSSHFQSDLILDGASYSAAHAVAIGNSASDRLTIRTAASAVRTTAGNSNIEFYSMVDGSPGLSVSAQGTGNVRFRTSVGAVTPLQFLDISGHDIQLGEITIQGTPPVTNEALRVVASGAVTVGGVVLAQSVDSQNISISGHSIGVLGNVAASGDILLTAADNIVFAATVAVTADADSDGSGALTLTADDASDAPGAGDLIAAAGANLQGADVAAAGHAVSFHTLTATHGSVSVTAQSTLSLNNAVSAADRLSVESESGNVLLLANLTAGSQMTVDAASGQLWLSSTADLQAAGVRLDAATQINLDGTIGARTSVSGDVRIGTSLNTATILIDGQISATGAVTLGSALLTGRILMGSAGTAVTITADADSAGLEDLAVRSQNSILQQTTGSLLRSNTGAIQIRSDASAVTLVDVQTEGTNQLSSTAAFNDSTAGILVAAATSVTIGNADSSTNNANIELVTTNGSISLGSVAAGSGNVFLQAGGGSIVDGNGNLTNVTAGSIALAAASGIGAADALEIDATTVAIQNSGAGQTRISDVSGGITVGVVGTMEGVTSAGAILLTANSPVVVASNITAAGSISIVASESSPPVTDYDHVTVNPGVTIQSTGDSLSLQAGDDIRVASGASLLAAKTISLQAGVADNDNDGDVNLNGTSSAGGALSVSSIHTAIAGSHSASADVTLTAQQHILLHSTAVVESSTGNVSVTADAAAGNTGGQVTMSDGAELKAATGTLQLTADGNVAVSHLLAGSAAASALAVTSSSGAITDAGDSAVDLSAANGGVRLQAASGIGAANAFEAKAAGFDAQTTSGNIRLNNSLATGTTLTALQSGGGELNFNQTAGTLLVTGTVASGNPAAGGDISIQAAGLLTLSTASSVNSSAGTGGSLSVSGTTAEGTVQAGAGHITLAGGGSQTVVEGALQSTGSVNIAADDDIIIRGSITTTGGDIVLTADSGSGPAAGDGHGGVHVDEASSLADARLLSAGGITVSGADLIQDGDGFAAGSPDDTHQSIRIDADSIAGGLQVQAAGAILLQSGPTALPGTVAPSIEINGQVESTGTATIFITAADNIEFDTHASANDGTITTAGRIELTARSGEILDRNLTREDWLLVADQLAISASTGIGTFDANSAADAGRDIDVSVAQLAAVTTTGDLFVSDAGELEIGTVTLGGSSLSGLRISGGAATDDLYVSESGTGALVVNQAVTNASGGDVRLSAAGTTVGDLLQVNANVTAAGNGGIEILATGSTMVAAGVQVSTDDAGTSGDPGNISISGEMGVLLATAASLRTDAGDIAVTGGHSTGLITVADTAGVRLTGATVQSTSGQITITGTGGDAGQENEGIKVESSSVIRTESGDIGLRGQGGTGISSEGIQISGSSVIESATGSLDVSGIGGAGGNIGLLLDGNGIIRSTGSGAGVGLIQLSGTAGGAADGLQIGSSLAGPGLVQSVDGEIRINGSSPAQAGIRFESSSQVVTTGSAGAMMQASGSLSMDDLAMVRTAGGLVQISATADVVLGSIQAIGGEIQLQSASGAILDGGDTNFDLIADRVAVRSALGIGPTNALETAVNSLAATTEIRNVLISNFLSTGLQIGTVDGLSGVTILDSGNVNSGSDVLVRSAGSMTVSEAIDNRDGGHLSLVATDTLQIDANLSANSTGAVLMHSADGDLVVSQSPTTGITTDTGSVLALAGGRVDVASNITSSTGAIGLQAATDLTLQTTVETAGDVVIAAGAVHMQQNSLIRGLAVGGNRIVLSSTTGSITVEQIDAGSGMVLIQSAQDVLDRAADATVNVTANRLQVSAGGQVGQPDSANPGQTTNSRALNTAVAELTAFTGTGLHVQNSTNLSIDEGLAAAVTVTGFQVQTDGSANGLSVSESTTAIAGLSTTSGPVKVVSGGHLHIQQSVTAGANGDVLLEARSANPAHVNVRAGVSSAAGHITLLASNHVRIGDVGIAQVTVQSDSGTVLLHAADGDIQMQPNATVTSNTGAVMLQAREDVLVGRLQSAGAVSVTAGIGAILDADADNSTVDITANQVRLQAASTIGHPGATNNAIDLNVDQVAAAASGFIHLNAGGSLAVDAVDVTVQQVAFSDGATAVSAGPLSGIRTDDNDLLFHVENSLSLNQRIDAGAGTVRIGTGGHVTQSAVGSITADALAVRITAGQPGQHVTLGTADNSIRLLAVENASEGGAVTLFDSAADLRIGQVTGQHNFGTTTGLQTNAGNINITADGSLYVDRDINAAHNQHTTSLDEHITLISRNGDFVAARGLTITTDENPAPGVFEDTTNDRLTIIAGLESGNGVVDLPADVQLRTDGGVARQLSPRPDGFAAAPAIMPETAFVTLSDPANMRSSLTFQNGGFLGILDLIFGLPGEENLQVVIDWGVVSQTSLTVGIAGDANPSSSVAGALEFSTADDDKNIFYIDEGGQRYRIPHTYAIADLATTPNDRNGRQDNPNIIGVRFSVAQHPSINVWGQQVTNPTGGANDTPDDFSADGTFQQITDATGAVINLPDAGLALLTSTDTNPLSEFAQQAVEAPIAPTTPTPTGTPVGKAEWEFIAGPTPGRIAFDPTTDALPQLAQPDVPVDFIATVSVVSDLTFDQGVSSDSAIGTEVFLQIQRRYERDAEPEIVIAKIADQSVVATREHFEEFVRQHPELTDGAGYEIWLVTKTGGQSVEQPIVEFEITAGRPGPAMEDLPAQLETPALQDIDFEQPGETNRPREDSSVDEQTSATPVGGQHRPASEDTSKAAGDGERPLADPPVAASVVPEASRVRNEPASLEGASEAATFAAGGLLMGSAARFCRRLHSRGPRFTRAAALRRRLAGGQVDLPGEATDQVTGYDRAEGPQR